MIKKDQSKTMEVVAYRRTLQITSRADAVVGWLYKHATSRVPFPDVTRLMSSKVAREGDNPLGGTGGLFQCRPVYARRGRPNAKKNIGLGYVRSNIG